MTYQEALQYERDHPHEIRQAVWDMKAALEWEAQRAKAEKDKR